MKRVGLKEASQALGLTEYTLRQGILCGRFPAVFIGGRYLVSLEQIEEILQLEALESQQEAREKALARQQDGGQHGRAKQASR